MSWFRSQQIWRQPTNKASASQISAAAAAAAAPELNNNLRNLTIFGHRSASAANCRRIGQDDTNEANIGDGIKRRRSSRAALIKQTEVRNIDNNDQQQRKMSPLNVNLLTATSQLVGPHREFTYLPVASSSSVPRLVSTREDDESENRVSEQRSQIMDQHQHHRVAATSQPRAGTHHTTSNSKSRARNKKKAKLEMQTTSFLMTLLCGSLLTCFVATNLTTTANGQQQQLQRFEVHPDPQYLVENGHEARLRCLIRNRQGECHWQRNNRVVGPAPKKYLFPRQPEDGDCSLVIKNASVHQDDGVWRCEVTSADGLQETMSSRESRLVVLVPPENPQLKNVTLTRTHRQLVVEENLATTVDCEIRGGNPAPQIEWILDGKNITKESVQASAFLGQAAAASSASQSAQTRITKSHLTLGNIRRTMNGKNLTCVGVHPTIIQTSSAELDVQYPPTVSVPQREYSIVEGSPLSIGCQVDANPPASEVGWRLANDPSGRLVGQFANLPGRQLTFDQTGRELNQNTFQCLARNVRGSSTPAEVKLNVLYPPTALNASGSQPVVVNTDASLYCLFAGNPQPEIRWIFTDPLGRQPANSVQIDNPNKREPHHLSIQNVSYRNEGDYHCEARNKINGQEYYMRSSNILLDVYGEPQFLAKSPSYAKVIQGTKSDISLTFCSDPAPKIVQWVFGSLKIDVRLNNINNGQQLAPSMLVAPPGGAISKRFQAHPLQPIQMRQINSSLSSSGGASTCFEAKLTLLDPELNDQREYSLVVENERGKQVGAVRLRVTSPLSPVLMITSAFVTICGLFLCSLVFIFLMKRRHDSAASNQQNGTGSQQSSEKGAGSVEHLVSNNHISASTNGGNANTNGLLQHAQTRGVVNGSGNGLANGAANPASSGLLAEEAAKLHHNLISMAASDTSGDQKQLLASNSSSDRNSPTVSGSTNNTNTCVDFNVNLSSSVGGRSSSNHSSPSPLNHISVEHDFHHDTSNNGSTYQPGESVTNDAELSPHSLLGRHTNSALIYANLEYSEQQHPSMMRQQLSPPSYRSPSQQQHGRLRQQVPADTSMSGAHSPTESSTSSTVDSRLHSSSSIRRSVANRDSLSRSSARSQQENDHSSSQSSPRVGQRPSVGATIAMMNSLAAAAASSNPSSVGGNTGVLNGAIQQQLANSKQNKKPAPPKPPKPSIQQRSRFYQQHQQLANSASPIGDTLKNNNDGLVMIGSHNGLQRPSANERQQQVASNDQLAAEYSRIAFPASAEL